MKRLGQILIVILCILPLHSAWAQEQNYSETDLSQIKIDQLSDDQVQQIIGKAEQSGMTMEQMEQMARARGMSQIEIDKLRTRAENLQNKRGSKTDSDKFRDRTRNYNSSDEPTSKNDSLLRPVNVKKDEKLDKEKEKEDIFGEVLEEIELPEDKIFGHSLFKNNKLTFEPFLNMPTPANYQLGPGDEVIIDVWGASQATYEQKINPEGYVFIPNLGPVYLSGLTIDEATGKLRKELGKIYGGLRGGGNTQMKVSIGDVRSIKINIVGEATMPGTYTLPSLATVFNALYAAGGPSLTGTLRHIKLIRDNKTIADIDFYDYLLRGEQKDNLRLRDQDVIYIMPYENRVDLKGQVKREFMYDMKDGETLKDLIDFSGGYSSGAYSERMKVFRKTGKENRVLDVSKLQIDTFKLFNGDEIQVDSILERYENRVEVKGAVYRAGIFAVNEGLTLKQLIEKADGLRGDAFKNRVSIYRTREDYTMEVIPVDLNQLYTANTDIELKREDLVVIPSIFDLKEEYFVEIEGEVRRPGQYLFVDQTSVEDLVLQAGGFMESASTARLEVARRVKNSAAETASNQIAEIYQFQITKDLKLTEAASKFVLQPFDKVFIRRSPGYEVQSIVTIEGEVAFPGKYTIANKGERISDFIQRAGGITPDAYAKGARLVRKLPVDEQMRKKALQKLKSQMRDSMKIEFEEDQESAIGIMLDEILKQPKSNYDLLVEDGDVIKVPKLLQTVRLSGEVLSPVLVRYDKSYGFRGYVSRAGGFAPNAKKGKSYVIYANGTIDRTRKVFFINSYPKIEPGAEIVVPKKAERRGLSAGEAVGLGSAISSMALIIVTIINSTK